jgi:putative sugar O-methyltransferase
MSMLRILDPIKSFLKRFKKGQAHTTALTPKQFAAWWGSFRQQVSPDLKTMVDYFIQSGLISRSSSLWNFIGKANIEMLAALGFENFKKTLASNYFTWIVDLDTYAANLLKAKDEFQIEIAPEELKKTHFFLPIGQFLQLTKECPQILNDYQKSNKLDLEKENQNYSLFFADRSEKYNLITALLISYVQRLGGGPLLSCLEEPTLGSPPYILWEGKRVSQDILNSILEYITVSQHCDLNQLSRIVEIGAGYGRTAYCFLNLSPSLKYVICDIPPTLYVSQTYLSQMFPQKKIFKFRPFQDFKQIEEEYSRADLVFLTPDQLDKIPDKSVDLFMAIGCMQEMKRQMIVDYFHQIDRLSSRFYFKSTEVTVTTDETVNAPDTYPIPSHWTTVFRKNCFVPADHFHAFFKF